MKIRENNGEADLETGSNLHPENPRALYETPLFTGIPGSLWERLTRFAHRRKRLVFGVFALVVCLVLLSALGVQGTHRPERLLLAYVTDASRPTDNWAYRVGTLAIPAGRLRELYATMAEYRLGPEAATRARAGQGLSEFIRAEADTDMLVLEALRSRSLETPEARQVLMHELRRAAAEYAVYARLRARGFSHRLKPDLSEGAMEVFLKKHSDYFRRNGLRGRAAVREARRLIDTEHRQQLAEEMGRERQRILTGLRETAGYQLR